MTEIIKKLANSDLKLIERETGIPYDRMYKWTKGKSSPKTEDFNTLTQYFGGTFSNKSKTDQKLNMDNKLVASLEKTISTQEKLINTLEAENNRLLVLNANLNHENESLRKKLGNIASGSKAG
ncbi:hypothetical protein BCY91_13975 [Pelobium manganitolerans]|uniref:Uncharacterized protein n=1 Tax=Pelobium manganitolerans TaxID=1842495 RepID=A0A419S9T6_9SPHI|nr:hypothetical protein [Pelobium manganitolerans]RKD18980.1 hypothetical protein BCY91_13975 [Pelobium manganitolerans]